MEIWYKFYDFPDQPLMLSIQVYNNNIIIPDALESIKLPPIITLIWPGNIFLNNSPGVYFLPCIVTYIWGRYLFS